MVYYAIPRARKLFQKPKNTNRQFKNKRKYWIMVKGQRI